MPAPALVAFDLDDTLAPSKTRMDAAMVAAMTRLLTATSVCIISGGNHAQFVRQVMAPLGDLPADAAARLHLMPTCGTQYYRFVDGEWQRIYAEPLTADEIARASAAIELRATELGLWEAETWGPRIEDRETQVTFSALGQQAPVEAKTAWDADGAKKEALRDAVQRDLPDLEVRSGGSTSIDVTRRGIDKAYGMRRLSEATSIALEDMVFVGDRLDEGGNDFPVVATGVHPIATEGPEMTIAIIDGLLAD